MSIVLNEHEWAENAIKTRNLGRKPSETLQKVARYYIDMADGKCSKANVMKKLSTFLTMCEPNASIPKWSDTLDFAVSLAFKRKAVSVPYIAVKQSEIDKITALRGRQTQRLAFTLLCLSKYWYAVEPQTDYWVTNKDSEIISLANIKTSIRRQSAMYGELRDAGLIRFAKKIDNTSVRVCFADEEASPIIKITDMRNLGYQYLKYLGEPYFECENCGIVTRVSSPNKGRKQKYCCECASEIRIKQKVESVMKGKAA